MEPQRRKILDEKYYYFSNPNVWSDIYEHLPTFRKYARECDTIIEMGTRSVVGTWGFLMGLSDPARDIWQDHLFNHRWNELDNMVMPSGKKIVCIDIDHPNIWGNNLLEIAIEGVKQWGVELEFRQQNTLENEIE